MTGRVFQLVKSVPRLVLSISAVLAVAPAFAADTPAKPVKFSKDVAPIFQAKCQECHQPGSIAPMSLITFQDVRPWARSIKERVASRQMPPWHIDRSIGVQKFKNDMSLTDEQVDTIIAWVDGGALQGDRSRHQVLRVHHAGGAPGRVVPTDVRHPHYRASLGQDGGNSADEFEGTQGHSSL